MMKKTGMTLIVKNVAKLVTAFVVLFAVFVALTGHLGPGGGFAGGVILAVAVVLTVLAFGGEYSRRLLTEPACHVWDAVGALGFLLVGLGGYAFGGFFFNFLDPPGNTYHLMSAGAIPLSNLAILIKVGAGIGGVLLALFAYRLRGSSAGSGSQAQPMDKG